MKFQKIFKSVCVTAIVLLSGCVPTYHQYTRSSSTPWDVKKVEPPFSGWDSDGKLKSKSSIQGVQQIQGKTLLNEDTIVCESNEILLKKAENLSKYPTGTLFMEDFDSDLKEISRKSYEAYKSKSDAIISSMNHVGNQSRLEQISDDIKYSQASSKSDSDNKSLDESYDYTKRMMKTCTVNKIPLPVEIVERKPISKLAKIKWNGSEVWTYESHLTFRN